MMANPIPAMLFAMECEGLINTPEGKINKFIKEVQSGVYGSISRAEVRERAASAGFNEYDIETIIYKLGM